LPHRRSTHTITPSGDGATVVKRYRSADRGEPHREWDALRLLHRHAPGLAPRPLDGDLDGRSPWVAMQYLTGAPLGGVPLTDQQAGAVVESLDRMHASVPARELRALPPDRATPRVQLDRIRPRLAAQPRPVADPVVTTAYDTAGRWCRGAEADRLAGERHRTVLARADHNLPNFLWDGERVRLVDFEDSGQGDRCTEFAELVEHIAARSTPDRTWEALLDDLTMTPAERRRLLLARRLAAISWFLLLLPGQAAAGRNPPGSLQAQALRLLGLI
jgi:aminoglycoside phosphotransferase